MKTPRTPYFVLVALVSLWCVGIVAAPVFRSIGETVMSGTLYALFSKICHQLPERSFSILGEPAGVCVRCFAIYAGFLVSLLFLPFIVSLRNVRIPHPRVLVALLVPMLIDVVLNDTGLQASTTLTRIGTGLLLGCALPWFVVPPFLEAMEQLRNRPISPGGFFHARKTQ